MGEAQTSEEEIVKGGGKLAHGERMIQLLKSGYGSDVVFTVGPQQVNIRAHKLILGTHSSVFFNLFSRHEEKEKFLVDAKPQYFQLFLQYVYSGHKVKDVEHAFPLLQLSIKYQILELELQITKFLKQEINDKTVVQMFEQATICGGVRLQTAALKYILRHASRILDSPDFLELSKPNLIKILGRDDLAAVNELQVFDAFIRWGKSEMSRQKMPDTQKYLRSVLEDMIPLIRFPLMDKSDFSLKVAALQILTVEEVTEILLYFNVNTSKRTKVPPGKFNATPRVRPTR